MPRPGRSTSSWWPAIRWATRRRAVVQVIGFVDYRGLPWLPIIGLLTVVVGVYVFLRVPRRRAGPTPAWSGDGTLEEIELE